MTRMPTLEDIQVWARTPILTIVKKHIDPEKGEVFEPEWQRFTKGDEVKETLEGIEGTFILKKLAKGSFQLVGVES